MDVPLGLVPSLLDDLTISHNIGNFFLGSSDMISIRFTRHIGDCSFKLAGMQHFILTLIYEVQAVKTRNTLAIGRMGPCGPKFYLTIPFVKLLTVQTPPLSVTSFPTPVFGGSPSLLSSLTTPASKPTSSSGVVVKPG